MACEISAVTFSYAECRVYWSTAHGLAYTMLMHQTMSLETINKSYGGWQLMLLAVRYTQMSASRNARTDSLYKTTARTTCTEHQVDHLQYLAKTIQLKRLDM